MPRPALTKPAHLFPLAGQLAASPFACDGGGKEEYSPPAATTP